MPEPVVQNRAPNEPTQSPSMPPPSVGVNEQTLEQGRALARTYLVETKGYKDAEVDLFLKSLDPHNARIPIYGPAANRDFTALDQAYGIFAEKRAQAIRDSVQRVTESEVQGALPGSANPGAASPTPQAGSTQAPAQTNPVTPNGSTPQSENQTQTPEPAPGPRPIEQQPVEQQREAGPSTRVQLHYTDRCGRMYNSVHRDLRLSAEGELQMRFRGRDQGSVWLAAHDHTTNISCTCLFVDNGKVYDSSGRQVTQLSWGNNHCSTDFVLRHVSSLKEGELSTVGAGYINDLRHNGQHVVFTKGLPPVLRPQQTEQAPTPAPQNTPAPVPQPPAEQQQTPRPTPNPVQQAEAQLPQVPVTPERENPTSSVAFSSTDRYGFVRSVNRDLRIGADGNLQMRFIDSEKRSVWLEPNDRSTNTNVSCLYHHQGKLYDAQGRPVQSVNWAGNTASASNILRYVEPLEAGKVSSLRQGYYNEVSYQGRRVVFTEGLPPALRPSPQTTTSPANPERTEPRQTQPQVQTQPQPQPSPQPSPQQEVRQQPQQQTRRPLSATSRVSLSVAQPNGGYWGTDLDFRRGADGNLEIAQAGSNSWQKGNEFKLTLGQKRDLQFELLYYHEGKIFDSAGKEVPSLMYGDSRITAENYQTHLMRYAAQRNDGAVFGMQRGILNDVRHEGRQVVFVKAPPPAQ